MAYSNTQLKDAKNNRKDEFYTRLEDIENEMRHYRKHFKGKTVLCNCDDPFESNFFKYFVLNFNRLGLKKLIATCYTGSPIGGKQLSLFDVFEDASKEYTPYKAVVTRVYDVTGDGGIDMLDVAELFKQGDNSLEVLEGNGDYRSPECLELMDEADIVVTNPPFSLFREYVATLMEHKKKFIIIGHQNAVSYREIFPLFKNNQMWLGYGFSANVGFFSSPYEDTAKASQHKEGLIRVSGVMWFTNLDIKKRHEQMILIRRYDPDLYQTYDNYDAIEVGKTADIPCDYAGLMGVPVSFMDRYNPDQFEIIGMTNLPESIPDLKPIGKEWCDRYFAQGGTGHVSANMWGLVYYTPDGKAKRSYARILIRNKNPELPKE